MRWVWLLLAVAGGTIGSVRAQQSADPMEWLGRIVAAAQRLSYTGTFVYQSGGHTETSRITHLVDGSGEHEKLEILDGSPREVVRTNEEVRCFLPAEHMVIVDRQGGRKLFPGRLPASLSSLSENYRIRDGGSSRVAGFDSRLLLIEPKDNLRYGHMLWADQGTGLLLKARMVNEKNVGIEQFYFTQLQIGGVIDQDALKSRFTAVAGDWRVNNAHTMEPAHGDDGWTFNAQVPGFKKTAGMKRQLQDSAPPIMHYVFTDGLAAISVFVEPLAGKQEVPKPGVYRTGAINVYRRVVGDQVLTLVGEVPARTLVMLGDGAEQKRN